jgi:hypothetical protein
LKRINTDSNQLPEYPTGYFTRITIG